MFAESSDECPRSSLSRIVLQVSAAICASRTKVCQNLSFLHVYSQKSFIFRPVRRAIELIMLLKAVGAFFILVYIHITFSQTPATCLDHIKNDWPRDGILRVEILRNSQSGKAATNDLTILRNKGGLVSIDPSTTLPHEQNGYQETHEEGEEEEALKEMQANKSQEAGELFSTTFVQRDVNQSTDLLVESTTFASESLGSATKNPFLNTNETVDEEITTIYKNESLERSIKFEEKYDTDANLKSKVPEMEKIANAVWTDDQYVVEYSLEYGFLRLSAATRQRLNIPVHVVTLDPQADKCFGDAFSRFILHEFLGYDDLLMASVKVLAEQEDNQGYLR